MFRSSARVLLAAMLLLSAAAAPAAAADARQIDIKSSDGTVLRGSYYAAETPGPGLLLMHACNKDRTSWTGLATAAAAKGYHVLAFDFRGFGESGGDRFQPTPESQEIINRQWPQDVDAAFAWLTSQPGVEKGRIAAAGASCGVNQSVQLASRHPEVRTVVLLSGNVTAPAREFLRDTPRLPIFAAASRGDGGAVDSMRWTLEWSRHPSNTFVEYKAAGHGTEMFDVEKGLQPKILGWLDAHLRKDATAAPASSAKAEPSPAETLWAALNEPGGVERARKMYDELKVRHKDVVLLPETETNLLGYQLLQSGNAKDAVAVFQLNADTYPQSANTYDSLSDGYLALGKTEEAKKYAEKAIQLLDKDVEASPQFKQLVRESAEKKLKELK